jgi:hypothetical protein
MCSGSDHTKTKKKVYFCILAPLTSGHRFKPRGSRLGKRISFLENHLENHRLLFFKQRVNSPFCLERRAEQEDRQSL